VLALFFIYIFFISAIAFGTCPPLAKFFFAAVLGFLWQFLRTLRTAPAEPAPRRGGEKRGSRVVAVCVSGQQTAFRHLCRLPPPLTLLVVPTCRFLRALCPLVSFLGLGVRRVRFPGRPLSHSRWGFKVTLFVWLWCSKC